MPQLCILHVVNAPTRTLLNSLLQLQQDHESSHHSQPLPCSGKVTVTQRSAQRSKNECDARFATLGLQQMTQSVAQHSLILAIQRCLL
jgi:hypothetical protein